MQAELQLNVEGFAYSSEFEAHVRDRIAVLEQLEPRIQSCRVSIGRAPPGATGQGRFSIGIEARVAGASLEVRHDHDDNVQVALAYALQALRRQLVQTRKRPLRVAPRGGRLPATAVAAPA